MDILRSKTPQIIRKEIYVFLLAYNLLRSLMWDAGSIHNTPALRLSLQGTRNHLNNFIPQLLSTCDSLCCKIYQTLLVCIVHKKVPDRPERYEPRVTKRRQDSLCLYEQTKKRLKRKISCCLNPFSFNTFALFSSLAIAFGFAASQRCCKQIAYLSAIRYAYNCMMFKLTYSVYEFCTTKTSISQNHYLKTFS